MSESNGFLIANSISIAWWHADEFPTTNASTINVQDEVNYHFVSIVFHAQVKNLVSFIFF